MPDNTLGYSFAPTFDNAQQARQNAQASAPSGAIQTLNFRLPKVTSAPSPLSSDQQVGTTFGGAVLQSVLRTILGADAASAMAPSSGPVGDDQASALLAQLAAMARPTVPSQNRPSGSPMPGQPVPPPVPPDVNGEAVGVIDAPQGAPQFQSPWDNPARNPVLASKYGDFDPINQYAWGGNSNGTFIDYRGGRPDTTPTPAIHWGNDYNPGGLLA